MSALVHNAHIDPTATTSPQPLVQCAACGKEPRDVVETPCCGDVWCWHCAVARPPSQTLCSCGQPLSVEDFRPAKAIQALLKRKPVASASRSLADLTCHDLLACPENCGAVLPVNSLEEHIKTCGEVEEPCPNGCYERNLKRKDVPAHVRDDCPLATVSCKFGCDETILRRELDDHMKDSVAAHLERLHSTVEAQQARIALLENDKALVQAKRRRCVSFLLKARKAAMVALSVVALVVLIAVLVRDPMAAKVSLVVGLLVILRVAFNYWAARRQLACGGLQLGGRRRPFRSAETNVLFGMLCVAVLLTLWPFLFAFML